MIELFFLAIICMIALGLGKRIVHPFSLRFDCWMEEQLIAIGLGFGGFIVGAYLLGAFHVLSVSSILSMLAISLAWGLRPLITTIISSRSGIKTDRLRFDRWTWAFISVLLLIGIFNLLGAMAPTTDTDGLAYHLAVPKFYLEQGGFTYNPIMVFNWPSSAEMLYLVTLAISSDSLAKILHSLFGVMSALIVYLLTKEWFGKDAGIMATILFYAMPLVGLESGIAYVDLVTTFYTLAGTHLFMRWYLQKTEQTSPPLGRRHGGSTLFLSGIFIGIGASTKWNGPVTIIILALFCLHKIISSDTGSRGKTIGSIILFLLIASSFSFLWYAKNYALTGNPVAPFLGEIIPTKDWSAENTAAYKASVSSLYLSPLHFLFIPWALTMKGTLFGELTYLGPWLLMLLPLALLIKRWPRATIFILLSSLLYYIVWFLTSQQSRLLLPTLALLCGICGWIATHERFASLWMVIRATLLVSIILALPFTMLYNGKGAAVSLGLESRQHYTERLLPDAATLHYASSKLAPNSKILLIRENNAYLLNKPYLWGSAAMQGLIDTQALEPIELYNQLKRLGFTHIIVNRAITCADPRDEERHCPDIKGLLEDARTKERITLLHEKNKAALYAIS